MKKEIAKTPGLSKAQIKEAQNQITEAVSILGNTLSPQDSPSGNLSVVVSDRTGAAKTTPKEEQVVTMGHELYGHAHLYVIGRPWIHTNGLPQSYYKDIEDRTRRNYRQGLPNSRTVKPKK